MFTSRDTLQLLKHKPRTYSEQDLATDIAHAVLVGEQQGDRHEASRCIDRIARRFKNKRMYRKLWNAYTQFADLYALKKKWVGHEETGAQYQYAGPAALKQYATRETRRFAFENNHKMLLPGGVSSDGTRYDDYSLPLASICRTPVKHFAELYTITVGISKYAKALDWEPFFWTFTAPGEYHSNPSSGQCSYNGATPFQAHQWIYSRFINIRAYFAKRGLPLLGLRVVEVHKDGCPHWHVILFYPSALAEEFASAIKRYIPNAHCTENTGEGKPATYAFKYLKKGTEVSDTGNAVRAQLSAWGIRQFAFLGSLDITLWRKLRAAPNSEQVFARFPEGSNVLPSPHLISMWRAARRGDFYTFMTLNNGLHRSPYRITADPNQPQLRSLNVIPTASVPWPVKYATLKPKAVGQLYRLPVGYVGWMIQKADKQSPDDVIKELDFSCLLDRPKLYSFPYTVTVILNDSRKAYYTFKPAHAVRPSLKHPPQAKHGTLSCPSAPWFGNSRFIPSSNPLERPEGVPVTLPLDAANGVIFINYSFRIEAKCKQVVLVRKGVVDLGRVFFSQIEWGVGERKIDSRGLNMSKHF